ncbi:MAG: 23S rRNA (uracil(1939)-C(5))-methyltransferase RlmD [Bacteroidetes bacterium]|nr:23S rRNA (uracil(1939)-C(5))-methyltransferase RlmD [Bacteroidota bacterium]
MKKKKERIQLQNIRVTDYAAEGRALVRHEGKVIFISGAIPGDTVDLMLTKNKKDWAEARVTRMVAPSPNRLEPFCRHFGICGGCKWQMLPYNFQLQYKQQETEQNLRRIGKVALPPIMPIIGSDDTIHYRNKLEFTFSNKRYLTNEEIGDPAIQQQQDALGYHAPRIFDKVIDISECYLMDDVNNLVRNTIRDFAKEHGFVFYDIKEHSGWLRNIIVRYCSTGELMVNICLHYEEENNRKLLLDHLLQKVPAITTLLYTINPKWNDTIYDLTPQVYFGKGYVTEKLEQFEFIISPKSFFQTNTRQAEKLYAVARDFAGLTGNEIVYDLYCGTGSIGIFVSPGAKKIIGVEVVEDAIEDAKRNAAINHIAHASFFAGDVIKICNDEFFATHGKPDVIITDPPRAGMHEKLVVKLLEMAAPKIVYVSCNTATLARDIALLAEKYTIEKIQPVDMFPHTHHIECVVLLTLTTTNN